MTGSARPDFDPASRAWQLISRLVLDQDRRAEVAEAIGMSFARSRALRRLVEGPRTLRELAALLGADPPYVTLIVDDLEQRGLVEKTPHPSDRRAKLVRLTDAGRRAAAVAEEILGRPPAGLASLPDEDARALVALLERVTA